MWIAKGMEPLRWALVVGIAYTLASTAMFFISATPATPSAPQVSPSSVDGKAAARVDLGEILNAHLFGRAPNDQDAGATLQPTAKTRLPLTLQGVFVTEPTSDSAAIIARKGNPGRLYAIGDEVPGNATLRAVRPSRSFCCARPARSPEFLETELSARRTPASGRPTAGNRPRRPITGPAAGRNGKETPRSCGALRERLKTTGALLRV